MLRLRAVRTASLATTLLAGTFFAGTANAADGCPDGTYGVAVAPDGTAYTVIYDAFQVTGGDGGPTTATATCNIEVAPAAAGYSLYTAQHRGFALLDEGQNATFTDPNGDPAALNTAGPYEDAIPFDQMVALDPGEALALNFTIDLVAGDGPFALATLETTDYRRIGFTTLASVEASMAAISRSLAAAMNQLRGTADYLLLGGIGPFDAPDGFGAVAAAGSSLFGVTGRITPMEGLTVLGGAALITQGAGTIDIGLSPLLGGAVRYMLPGIAPTRFFLEAGLTAAPQLNLTIARPYENNGVMTEGTGTTAGHFAALFGRAGTALDLGNAGDLVLTATLAHNTLRTDAYSEPMTAANPFAASFAAARYASTSISTGLAWTVPVGTTLDVTLAGEVGRNFGAMPVTGDVGFIGPVSGGTQPGLFANGSVRLGYHPTERLSIDAFAVTLKTAGAPAEVQVGGALRLTF